MLLATPGLCRASSVEPDDVRIADPSGLREALGLAGQSSDLVRLAGRVDTAVLVDALEDGDPDLARMALSVVAHVERPAAFLPVLVELSASRDRDLASRAARAAAHVASGLDARSARGCADEQCDLVEVSGPLAESLGRALETPGMGPDIRGELLTLLATDAGRTLMDEVVQEVVGLLGDPDPRVRVAAATLMTPPQDENVLEALLEAAGEDDEPVVVSTCLVAACAAMTLPEGREHERTFEKRLERFAGKLEPPAEAVAPVRSCLAGLGTPWASGLAAKLPGGSGR